MCLIEISNYNTASYRVVGDFQMDKPKYSLVHIVRERRLTYLVIESYWEHRISLESQWTSWIEIKGDTWD